MTLMDLVDGLIDAVRHDTHRTSGVHQTPSRTEKARQAIVDYLAVPGDVADAIEALIVAARRAEAEQASGSRVSEATVQTARHVVYDRLGRLGVDSTGWCSEREILAGERDRALAKVDDLEAKVLDLHHRLDYERRRAESTLAVHGYEVLRAEEPDRADRAQANEAQGWGL